jgi:hypothetical protein
MCCTSFVVSVVLNVLCNVVVMLLLLFAKDNPLKGTDSYKTVSGTVQCMYSQVFVCQLFEVPHVCEVRGGTFG